MPWEATYDNGFEIIRASREEEPVIRDFCSDFGWDEDGADASEFELMSNVTASLVTVCEVELPSRRPMIQLSDRCNNVVEYDESEKAPGDFYMKSSSTVAEREASWSAVGLGLGLSTSFMSGACILVEVWEQAVAGAGTGLLYGMLLSSFPAWWLRGDGEDFVSVDWLIGLTCTQSLFGAALKMATILGSSQTAALSGGVFVAGSLVTTLSSFSMLAKKLNSPAAATNNALAQQSLFTLAAFWAGLLALPSIAAVPQTLWDTAATFIDFVRGSNLTYLLFQCKHAF